MWGRTPQLDSITSLWGRTLQLDSTTSLWGRTPQLDSMAALWGRTPQLDSMAALWGRTPQLHSMAALWVSQSHFSNIFNSHVNDIPVTLRKYIRNKAIPFQSYLNDQILESENFTITSTIAIIKGINKLKYSNSVPAGTIFQLTLFEFELMSISLFQYYLI